MTATGVGRDEQASGARARPAVEALVRAEEVGALFARNRTAQVTVLVNSALVVVVLWGEAPAGLLVGWAGALWAVASGRIALGVAHDLASPGPAEAERWAARFTVGAALNGLLWGAAPLLVGRGLPLAHQVFLAFVLGGMAAGGALSNATRPAAFLAFTVPALAPMVGVLAAGGDRLRVVMAIMLGVFGAAVFAISRSSGRAFAEAARLRFANAELASGLAEANRELEARVAARTSELVEARAREREAELELARATRLSTLGALAAGVAHELGGPLGAVRSNLTFVSEELGAAGAGRESREELEQALDDAAAATDRVSGFVRQLVTLSHADGAVEHVPCDLRAALDVSLERARADLSRRARLSLALGEVPAVLGSHARLVQILDELLRSAVEALPEGAAEENEVRVETRLDAVEGLVVVEVSHTGRGLAPEAVERLWDPAHSTRPDGLRAGLGLTICRSLVAALGGRMSVSSRERQGTRVSVALQPAVGAG